ncbi:MAG: hypothetical protein ABID38_07005 [Candidatus Diapherotrites archaeon]
MPKNKILRKTSSLPWKTAEDVERLNIGKKRIGGYMVGDIYVGRIHFKSGSVHRVAVKRFKKPMDDKHAAKYKTAITELKEAGVRLPKMGMYKLPSGEWVQVSQLFGSTARGSRLWNKSFLSQDLPEAKDKLVEGIVELTKVANIGYEPARDLLEPFINSSKGFMPIDL